MHLRSKSAIQVMLSLKRLIIIFIFQY